MWPCVLAAQAFARLEFRLSPGTSPAEVIRAVQHRCEHVQVITTQSPVTLPRTGWAVDAARAACRQGFGHEPVLQASGGGIAAAGLLAARRIPVLLLGFAIPDNRMHAPNERLSLPVFARAVDTSVALLPALADRWRPQNVQRVAPCGSCPATPTAERSVRR
jgi:acetylornithine deacetylase/succinyl-diaminopimelate desuccinylase-like protein